MSVILYDVEERLIDAGIPMNNWSVGKPAVDLEYADDTLPFAVTTSALEQYLHALQRESELYGMSLSLTKTEYLPPPDHSAPIHFINGLPVPTTSQAKYLGSQVSWNKPTDTAINARMALAASAYSKLQPIWRSKLPYTAKLQIFRACVVNALTYSLATLSLEPKNFKRIDAWDF